MTKIQLLNKIAKIGTDRFPADYVCTEDGADAAAIMVRSAAMHDMQFPASVRAIARAGAGVNNIPVERCAEEGIVVFNTPGANANGVKELAIAALMLASRDIVGGVNWAATLTEDVAKQVEKGKSKFAGVEITGKKLGVIGLGAIGGMLANAATALGMTVVGCDPFLSVEAAWRLDSRVQKAASFDEIFATCDYISLHVPATKDTKGMINAASIATMKDGVRIINLARADLVNAADLKAALATGKIASYVTDFPTEETIGVPGIVAIPHLGASTNESEDNCAIMAADQLVSFLTCGNIKNSVNYPNAEMPHTGAARVCVMHKNVPGLLTQITNVASDAGLNIENMLNRSKGANACSVLDTEALVGADVIAKLSAIEGIRRVIVI